MTIQQLQYFLAVCEDLNFTRTAERLYLSRQALRMSIASLEKELCGELFRNVRNHLTLTEKGERFRAQATPVVAQFEQLCAQAYQDIHSEPLRFGVSVALVPDYLPMLGDELDAFRKKYPGIPLDMVSLSNDAVLEQLENGALDAGLIMDLGGTTPGLRRTALTNHTASILVSRGSPFWVRKSVHPRELNGQHLLVPGLRSEPLSPLWDALRESDSHPQIEIGEKFYQVRYLVQEQGYFALDRLESYAIRETDPIRDVILEGVPPICAAFLQPEQDKNACSDLLREYLQQQLKNYHT